MQSIGDRCAYGLATAVTTKSVQGSYTFHWINRRTQPSSKDINSQQALPPPREPGVAAIQNARPPILVAISVGDLAVFRSLRTVASVLIAVR
jgi:hypothetical protein